MSNSKMLKNRQDQSTESNSFAAILGLLAEMAKRVNENITKVKLEPMHATVFSEPVTRQNLQ